MGISGAVASSAAAATAETVTLGAPRLVAVPRGAVGPRVHVLLVVLDVTLVDDLAALGMLHRDVPLVESLRLVHGLDRCVRFFTAFVKDVSKAARHSRHLVLFHVHVENRAEPRKFLPQIVLSCALRNAGDVDVAVVFRVNWVAVCILDELLGPVHRTTEVSTSVAHLLILFVVLNDFFWVVLAQFFLVRTFVPLRQLQLLHLLVATVLDLLVDSFEGRYAATFVFLHSFYTTIGGFSSF